MKISSELEKKFKNVSISLSEKDKEHVFFRQSDPNVLIELAKYAQKTGDKVITFKKLKKLYNEDSEIRKHLFSLIQRIENKLTGSIIQGIANENQAFYLQAKNFELIKSGSKNKEKHFITVNKFLLDIKRMHHNQIAALKEIPVGGYVRLEDWISRVSLGMKAKLLKYSNIEFKEKILSSFSMTQDKEQINIAIDFFINLNILRNKVMHHDSVIGWIWNCNGSKINIENFILISTYFMSSNSLSNGIEASKKFETTKKLLKKEMLDLIVKK